MACGGTQCTHPIRINVAPLPLAGIQGDISHFVTFLRRLHDRQRQRHALRELDAHLLADIGVTREQAEAEGRKPFWR